MKTIICAALVAACFAAPANAAISEDWLKTLFHGPGPKVTMGTEDRKQKHPAKVCVTVDPHDPSAQIGIVCIAA